MDYRHLAQNYLSTCYRQKYNSTAPTVWTSQYNFSLPGKIPVAEAGRQIKHETTVLTCQLLQILTINSAILLIPLSPRPNTRFLCKHCNGLYCIRILIKLFAWRAWRRRITLWIARSSPGHKGRGVCGGLKISIEEIGVWLASKLGEKRG